MYESQARSGGVEGQTGPCRGSQQLARVDTAFDGCLVATRPSPAIHLVGRELSDSPGLWLRVFVAWRVSEWVPLTAMTTPESSLDFGQASRLVDSIG